MEVGHDGFTSLTRVCLLWHLKCSWDRLANKKAEVTQEYSTNFPTDDIPVEEEVES
jgi:hypothetical protein